MMRLMAWHGWGMHPAAWDSLARQLSAQHGMVLETPALPGYAGASAPEDYTLDALVDALLAEVTAPLVLCGWSLGALLALHAAQRHPDKVARLILLAATPSFVPRDAWPHGMTPTALTQFAEGVQAEPATALKRFIALFNQQDANARSIGRELARALASDPLPSAAVLAAGLDLLRETDLRAQAPHIVQPTLLLHGALDPLMPPASAAWLAATLPHARLEILAEAAHAPFLSDPTSCAALIAEFIDG